MTLAPPPFDSDSYGLLPSQFGIDKRHLYFLFDLLREIAPRNPLEIGTMHGGSAIAFLEAVKLGCISRASFCDPHFQEPFLTMIQDDKLRGKVTGFSMQSAALFKKRQIFKFDFVLVDGAHTDPHVGQEVDYLLESRTPVVVAHDTNATVAGHAGCEGAMNLKNRFQMDKDYYCLEDNKLRKGEETERGLFVAVNKPHYLEVARELFVKWM